MTTTLTPLSFVGKQPSLWKGGNGGGGLSSSSSHQTNTGNNSKKSKSDDTSGRSTRSVALTATENRSNNNSTASTITANKSRQRSTSITTTNNKKSYRPCFSDSDDDEDELFSNSKCKPSSKLGIVQPMLTSTSSSVIHRWKIPTSSSATLSAARSASAANVPSTVAKTNDNPNRPVSSAAAATTATAKAGFKNKIKRTRNIITMHRHVAFSEDGDDDDATGGNDDTREEELEGTNKAPLSMLSNLEERQITLSSSSSFVDRAKRFVVGSDGSHANHHRDDDESSSLLRYHQLEQSNSDRIDFQMDESSPSHLVANNNSKNRVSNHCLPVQKL
jgi:hypothetical protein